MSRIKLLVLLCLFCSFLTGCGYTIAGLDGSTRKTYYIESIRNTSTDMTITRHMRQDVTKFFLNYGVLEEKEDAEFVLVITLTEKNVDDSIRSTTREALISDLIITYHIQVEDKAGKLVYNRSISRNQKFTTGSTIQAYKKAELKAFEELTTEILTAFKYGFEST